MCVCVCNMKIDSNTNVSSTFPSVEIRLLDDKEQMCLSGERGEISLFFYSVSYNLFYVNGEDLRYSQSENVFDVSFSSSYIYSSYFRSIR